MDELCRFDLEISCIPFEQSLEEEGLLLVIHLELQHVHEVVELVVPLQILDELRVRPGLLHDLLVLDEPNLF